MFRVSYSREYDTNLYKVTLHAIAQTIVVDQKVLARKIGMNSRCSVGCKDITIHAIIDLGFVISESDRRLVI